MLARPGTAPESSRAPLAAAGAPAALVLRAAAKRYGDVRALDATSLVIARGERVAIVGPSGAGKSTLLGLLNTSLAPSAGGVEVLGVRIAGLSPRALRAVRARVGTIYQQLWLVPRATAMQNVVAGRLGTTSLPRSLLALGSRREAARVRALLERLGIGDKLHERVDRLSGGEQQRVAIARALHQDPEIVIADEPLASVDPARAAEISALLADVFAGRTLVVSTHRIEPLLPYVTRVIGLREGGVAFDEPAAALTVDDLSRLYASARGGPATSPRRLAAPAPEAPAGSVAVGASTAPGEFVLPRVIREFMGSSPGVRVTLAVRDSTVVAEDLVAGRLDVGFVGARTPHPDLHFEDFADDEVVLVAAPAFPLPTWPLDAKQAARLPRVEREPGSGTRAIVEDTFANLGAPLDPCAAVLEIGSLGGVKSAVLSGLGVGFLPRAAVREDVEAGRLRLVAIEGVSIPRRLFVVWRSDRPPGPAARRLVELARAAAGRGGRP